MAIAFDNATIGVSGVSHTTGSGSNRYLVVFVNTLTDVATACTYGGVAMTPGTYGANIAASVGGWKPFFLANPASGAGTVTVTGVGINDKVIAASYTGVSATGQPDNFTSGVNSTTNTTNSLTLNTVADNCWTVFVISCTGTVSTANPGTSRATNTTFGICDSNAAVTPGGTASQLGFNYSSNNRQAMYEISLAPTTGGGTGGLLNLMGVGT